MSMIKSRLLAIAGVPAVIAAVGLSGAGIASASTMDNPGQHCPPGSHWVDASWSQGGHSKDGSCQKDQSGKDDHGQGNRDGKDGHGVTTVDHRQHQKNDRDHQKPHYRTVDCIHLPVHGHEA